MSDRSLTALVDEATSWGPVDWWRLELRSFAEVPSAQYPLILLAPKDAVRTEYRGFSAGSCLQSLAYLLLLVAPLVGAAAMLIWLMGADSFAFPLAFAGLLTLITLPVTGWSELRRRRHPRAVARSALRTNTLMHVIPGAVAMLVAVTAGRDLLGDGAWAWLAVIGCDVVIYLAILVRGSTVPGGPQNPHDNVDQSIAEIPADTLRGIVGARDAAIDRLVARGLVGMAVGERARATAPGWLALTLAPDAGSGYYRPDPA